MSNPAAKARRSRAKDARQMPPPDESARHRPKRKKKPKPWEMLGPSPLFGNDMRWHKAESEEAALAWIEKEKRAGHDVSNCRIVGPIAE